VALVRIAADEIRLNIFTSFGVKKINKLVVTRNKLTNNFVGLVTSGLEPNVACGAGMKFKNKKKFRYGISAYTGPFGAHTYIHTYSYILTYVHTCMNLHTYMYTYTHTYIHTHTYKHTHIHTHTHKHTYIHTYVRTYTQTASRSPYVVSFS
jgi:hypothetical protein